MKTRCAEMVLTETEEFTKGIGLAEDSKKKESFLKVCNRIDFLSEKIAADLTELHAEIDRQSRDIKISLVFDLLSGLFEIGKDDGVLEAFCGVIGSSNTMTIKQPKQDVIQIDLIFDGIWRDR